MMTSYSDGQKTIIELEDSHSIIDADTEEAVVVAADTTGLSEAECEVPDVTPYNPQCGSGEVDLSMGHALEVQGMLPVLVGDSETLPDAGLWCYKILL